MEGISGRLHDHALKCQARPYRPGAPDNENGGGPQPRKAGGRRRGDARVRYRNELISIVSVRPGPTPIAEIGAPDISSRAFT